MNSAPSPWIDIDTEILRHAGADRFGIADAEPVASQAIRFYEQWLAAGRHGAMDYLERYGDIRNNPGLLLEGARSVICCAFAYEPPADPARRPYIAAYALGDDYHEVIRSRLNNAANEIRQLYGGTTRVCVDTAPLRERYWAVRSGLGIIGCNNQLIIPGSGSFFFLGEILTTVRFRPNEPLAQQSCGNCGRCIKACPTGALHPDGSIDARRCLSYLTIEHRGEFPDDTNLHGSLYGCDRCAAVCPHNAHAPHTGIAEFIPRKELLQLTAADVESMTQEQFSTLFRHSAIKRAKLAGLQRNARHL